MSLGILSNLIKPPHLTAPTASATPISFTSKGVFHGLWSRVADMYTSLLKSNDRIDNLQQMPVHEREVADAIIGWRRRTVGVDAAIAPEVQTLRQAISDIVTTTATPFATAMTRLNHAYKRITNHTVDDLTLERRRLLSQSQKARLAQVHDQMKDELANTKTNYNTATTAINEAGQSLTDLLALDKRQREELSVLPVGGPILLGRTSTFGDVNLSEPAKQRVCPNFEQRLEYFYSEARKSAFAALAASAGVVSRNLQGIKDGMVTATQAL